MHRNDHPTAVNGLHQKGDPAINSPATVVTDTLMNALQEEIVHVIEEMGIALDKTNNTQLLAAIHLVIGGTLTDGHYITELDLGDAAFKNTGRAAGQVAAGDHLHDDLVRTDSLGDAAFKNTGAGAGQVAAGDHTHAVLADGMLPIGVPVPWPTATPPPRFLLMFGQAFNVGAFPELARAYPSGVLPDLRAETIRGLDNWRGIDPGRGLLSVQYDAMQNITGSYVQSGNTGVGNSAGGAFSGVHGRIAYGEGGIIGGYTSMTFDASRVVRTSAETRVRNVAFNYICRAH